MRNDRYDSYLKGTYTAAQLEPHRKTARAWLKAHMGDAVVQPGIGAMARDQEAIAADPHREGKIEYRRVRAAKLVHQMASGSHKRWERERPGGGHVVEELHRYPPSRGIVLRRIGEQLERAAELVADQYTPPLLLPFDATTEKQIMPSRSNPANPTSPRVTEVTLTRADGQKVRFTRTDN